MFTEVGGMLALKEVLVLGKNVLVKALSSD